MSSDKIGTSPGVLGWSIGSLGRGLTWGSRCKYALFFFQFYLIVSFEKLNILGFRFITTLQQNAVATILFFLCFFVCVCGGVQMFA